MDLYSLGRFHPLLSCKVLVAQVVKNSLESCVRVSPSVSFDILLFKTCSHHCHKIMPSTIFYLSFIHFFLQIYQGDISNHPNIEFGQTENKKVEFGQLLVEIIKISTISRRNYLKIFNFRVSAINSGLKIPTF